jgi:hypothetical protein
MLGDSITQTKKAIRSICFSDIHSSLGNWRPGPNQIAMIGHIDKKRNCQESIDPLLGPVFMGQYVCFYAVSIM